MANNVVLCCGQSMFGIIMWEKVTFQAQSPSKWMYLIHPITLLNV